MARDPLRGLVDPKMYTHVSTDKDKTILKHKLGHQVTIAHSVLSPKMRTQLSALASPTMEQDKVKEADGGQVKPKPPVVLPGQSDDTPPPVDDGNKNKQMKEGRDKSGGVPSDSPLKTGKWNIWNEGGKVKMADGGKAPMPSTPSAPDTSKNRQVSQGATQSGGVPSDSPLKTGNWNVWAEGGEVCNLCGESGCKCQPNNPKLAESNKTPPGRKMYAEAGEVKKDHDDNRSIGDMVGHALSTIFSRKSEGNDNGIQPTPVPQAPTLQDAASVVGTPSNPPDPNFNSVTGQTSPQGQPTPSQDTTPAPTDQQASAQAPKDDLEAELDKPQTPAAAPQASTQPPTDNPMALQQQDQAKAQAMPEGDAKQELMQENQAFEHDLANGHITPETYQSLFAKRSTLGKIGTLFGLLVAGGGAGLTHTPNAVLGMMDKEIERDLAAQTTSKQNAQNFLRLNQAQLANTANIAQTKVDTKTKAFALAQSQMLQSTYHDLASKVDKMPQQTPDQQARKQQALQNLAMIYSKIGEKINNINDQAVGAGAFFNAMAGPQGSSNEQQFQNRNNAMRLMGPQGEMMARNAEEKHYPGIQGQASRPLTGADQEKLDSGINFNEKLNRFIDWTKSHSGDLNPADMNTGRAMAAELQGAYRQATHGGVYKEGEQNFIAKLIDEDPTKFLNKIRVLPQLNALSRENESRLNTTAKNLGFNGYKSPQVHNQQQEKMSKSGKPMVMKNGQWYYK